MYTPAAVAYITLSRRGGRASRGVAGAQQKHTGLRKHMGKHCACVRARVTWAQL